MYPVMARNDAHLSRMDYYKLSTIVCREKKFGHVGPKIAILGF